MRRIIWPSLFVAAALAGAGIGWSVKPELPRSPGHPPIVVPLGDPQGPLLIDAEDFANGIYPIGRPFVPVNNKAP